MPELILASQSPRRQELLDQIGLVYTVMPADIDESRYPTETAPQYGQRMALQKARKVQLAYPDHWILAADTVVVLDEQILGKPTNEQQAYEMLMQLSGRQHRVLTALVLLVQDQVYPALSDNQVWFAEIEPKAARAYCASGEPLDKAGAYAIQGRAAIWIKKIIGSYSGIMGLPLFECAQLLQQAGYDRL